MNKKIKKDIHIFASSTVSIIAIIVVFLALFDKCTVETNVLALFGIALIPWLIPYVKNVKLPGGVEVETLREEVDDFQEFYEENLKAMIEELAVAKQVNLDEAAVLNVQNQNVIVEEIPNPIEDNNNNESLDELILRFLERYSRWNFSPLRIVKWGSKQAGFGRLEEFDTSEVKERLVALHNQQKVRRKKSSKENWIYGNKK